MIEHDGLALATVFPDSAGCADCRRARAAVTEAAAGPSNTALAARQRELDAHLATHQGGAHRAI